MNSEQFLDALLSLPGMWGAQVSPDGRWAAWTWFRAGPAADVYVAPADSTSEPIRLTETPEDTFIVSWVPDSASVIVGQDTGGDERTQLFRVALDDPEKMIPLTEDSPDYFLRGGDLHPNGRWLVYGANYDFDAGQEIEPTCVYRHDIQSGERLLLAKPQKGKWMRPLLSPAGDYVLYSRADRHPAGLQIWLVGIDGQGDREIVNAGAERKAYASWFPDGQRVLVIAETDTHRKLGIWSVSDDTIRWVLDDPQRDIYTAAVPYRSEYIVVTETEKAVFTSWLLHPDTGEIISLPDLSGNLVLKAPAADGLWTALYFSSSSPVDLVLMPLDAAEPARFTSISRVWERTALTSTDLTKAESVSWTAADGLEIQGWLYRVPDRARGTIVYVHGGPSAHSTDQVNNQIQYFVREGLNVLDPNYRGSTGFGLSFREEIKKDGWGGREQDDIRAGIEWLLEQGIAEPGKVGITGTSYGGYSSWCGITRWPAEVLAAAAPVCGMTDLVVDYHTTRPDLRRYSEEMLGGSPDEAPETYYNRSPVNFLDQIKGQLLVVQGARDPNVTPENVRAVKAGLSVNQVDHKILEFSDEGHGISKPANQRTLYRWLAEFFMSAFKNSGG